MISKSEFEEIEGVFHDGLGTFAELSLANKLISGSGINQSPYNTETEETKMKSAIDRLPPNHRSRQIYANEIEAIKTASEIAATRLIAEESDKDILSIEHTARQFDGAKAGDVSIIFKDGIEVPISVKTDKSGKVAVADGQTRSIYDKWAKRYFGLTEGEYQEILNELCHKTYANLISDYLNVAEFVATVIIRKLDLSDCELTDFSRACPRNMAAVKHLLRQLLKYKSGSDNCCVVILKRSTGQVVWGTLLDSVDIESLTAEDISFRPSKPRDKRIGSEFCLKVNNKAIVTFQVKHRRGSAKATAKRTQFGDITTRLLI